MRQAYAGQFDGERSAWRGAVAGVVGGLVASWVMNRFQAGLSKAVHGSQASGGGQQSAQAGEDATQKAAAAIAEPVVNRPLTRQEKQAAGPAVPYAFGSTVGAIYGAAAELAPRTATA